MSNIDIIRWKRLINELKFLSEEIDLVDSIIYEYNKYFQEHYEKFCRDNNLDINKLNKENHQKISTGSGYNSFQSYLIQIYYSKLYRKTLWALRQH